jgi:hypothetical protein
MTLTATGPSQGRLFPPSARNAGIDPLTFDKRQIWAQSPRRRLSPWLLALRSWVDPGLVHRPNLKWLFVVTFPNGGSTALADFLAASPHCGKLTHNGEGQWLVPSMTLPKMRWDPSHDPSYRAVRAVWLNEARRMFGKPTVVVEKSPPLMCRLRALLPYFQSMQPTVLRFTRDPYATCASWARRRSPSMLARVWRLKLDPNDFSEKELFTELGRLWAQRARLMIDLQDVTDLRLTYEDFCADPVGSLGPLTQRLPELQFRADTEVRVKDYQPQRIRDMNAEQIALLSASQVGYVSAGLASDVAAVEGLGYSLR